MNVIITLTCARMDAVLITMVVTAASVSRATFSTKLAETAEVGLRKCWSVVHFSFTNERVSLVKTKWHVGKCNIVTRSMNKLLVFSVSVLFFFLKRWKPFIFQISMSVLLLIFVVMVHVPMFLAVIHVSVLLVLNVVALHQAVKVSNGIFRI